MLSHNLGILMTSIGTDRIFCNDKPILQEILKGDFCIQIDQAFSPLVNFLVPPGIGLPLCIKTLIYPIFSRTYLGNPAIASLVNTTFTCRSFRHKFLLFINF